MSATITLVLENIASEVYHTINNSMCSLNKCIEANKNNKNVFKFLNEQKKDLEKTLNDLNSHKDINNKKYTSSQALEIKREIDSIAKRVANIVSNKNIVNFIEEQNQKNSEMLMMILKENGVMAREAIDKLQENNEELSEENITNKINELRNLAIDEENLKKYKKEINQYLDEQNFESGDLVFEIKQIIKKYTSPQEITDCYAFIASKKNEITKIDDLANNLFADLQKNDHFVLLPEINTRLNDQGIIRKTYKLKNNTNNTIDITIDGQLNIQYKMGNYIGHACEKTANKIIDTIKNMGYTIATQKITRDISNAQKVMYMKN